MTEGGSIQEMKQQRSQGHSSLLGDSNSRHRDCEEALSVGGACVHTSCVLQLYMLLKSSV